MSIIGERRPLTGRKVTLMFIGAFTTIVGANMALILAAVGSFPGLETRAPYVESLNFEARRIAQEALNWTSDIVYIDGQLQLTLSDQSGATVVTPHVSMVVGRATSAVRDQEMVVEFDGRRYLADIILPPGNWQAKVTATALDGTEFSRRLPIIVGSIQ